MEDDASPPSPIKAPVVEAVEQLELPIEENIYIGESYLCLFM